MMNSPLTRPTRTAPTGPPQGMSEIMMAAEAALIARISSGLIAVGGEGEHHDLHFVAHAVLEERAQGAVGQAGGEDGIGAGPAFAAEEGTGDLAAGVHALFVFHREREEVDALADAAHGGGGEDDGVRLSQRSPRRRPERPVCRSQK